ncbi:hypothetical protein N6H14_04110 [Paenibacillus sp. CC-CFT747]|nr:hypothetical protein N6H14_04110 [Paenibacillus sp. CC-CFT747]
MERDKGNEASGNPESGLAGGWSYTEEENRRERLENLEELEWLLGECGHKAELAGRSVPRSFSRLLFTGRLWRGEETGWTSCGRTPPGTGRKISLGSSMSFGSYSNSWPACYPAAIGPLPP